MIVLAKQCGVAEAASVETYYFQPISSDWNYGIEVRGREVVSGRWISYVTVDIYRHEAGPERKMKSLGKFWVAPGEVRTNDLATFVVSNRTIRVEIPRTLALATVDRVVGAFAARKVHYPDTYAPQRAKVEQYDFTAPNKLTGPDQDGNYTITKGVNRGCEIKFTLEGEAVKIIKVSFFES